MRLRRSVIEALKPAILELVIMPRWLMGTLLEVAGPYICHKIGQYDNRMNMWVCKRS